MSNTFKSVCNELSKNGLGKKLLDILSDEESNNQILEKAMEEVGEFANNHGFGMLDMKTWASDIVEHINELDGGTLDASFKKNVYPVIRNYRELDEELFLDPLEEGLSAEKLDEYYFKEFFDFDKDDIKKIDEKNKSLERRLAKLRTFLECVVREKYKMVAFSDKTAESDYKMLLEIITTLVTVVAMELAVERNKHLAKMVLFGKSHVERIEKNIGRGKHQARNEMILSTIKEYNLRKQNYGKKFYIFVALRDLAYGLNECKLKNNYSEVDESLTEENDLLRKNLRGILFDKDIEFSKSTIEGLEKDEFGGKTTLSKLVKTFSDAVSASEACAEICHNIIECCKKMSASYDSDIEKEIEELKKEEQKRSEGFGFGKEYTWYAFKFVSYLFSTRPSRLNKVPAILQ